MYGCGILGNGCGSGPTYNFTAKDSNGVTGFISNQPFKKIEGIAHESAPFVPCAQFLLKTTILVVIRN